MAKINQIENALLALEGGKFQKICNAYLSAKGYSINAFGSVSGKDKTKTGTPDCFITTDKGSFLFIECTTEQEGVCKKFKEDIADKCLNEGKTKIPKNQIERIILFYNAKRILSPEEHKELYDLCEGIPLEIHSLSGIANDLYNDHRNIVRDELRISLDTGQIFTLDGFINEHKKNKASTPLDNEFLYREKELEALSKALESQDLILLSGPAGVGKTKLALEALKRYQGSKKDKNFRIHCIKSHGEPLYEDIKDYLSKDGEHIVLVDDANRISAARYIFELTQNTAETKRIKVIATVRDYALKAISAKTRGVQSVSEIIIEPFKEEEISKLLETSYEITNSKYTRRIWDISQGNPRIALMAGRVAKEKNKLSSLRNLEAIYDDYFSNIREELSDLNDLNVLRVSGIISFFRNVDLENQEQMNLVADLFQISQAEFAEIAFKLRDMEIADAFDKVVKISDQVLSTYLFYLAVFKQEALSFSDLLNSFALSQTNRLRDALYPCLNTFDGRAIAIEKIEPHVSVLWNRLEEQEDHVNLEKLVNLFAFMRTTKVLLYLKNKIQNADAVSLDIGEVEFAVAANYENDFILETLGKFAFIGSIEEISQALELLLDYSEKRPDLTSSVLHVLINEFGIGQNSYEQGYLIQIALIETLQKRILEGDRKEYFAKSLFAIAFHLLKTQHQFTESRSSRAIAFGWIHLPVDEELLKLRKAIWDSLLNASDHLSEGKVLKSYLDNSYDIQEKEAFEYDAKILCEHYLNALNPEVLKDTKLINQLLDKLDGLDIEYDQSIRNRFQSDSYQFLKLLTDNREEILELGYEEFQVVQKQRIKAFTGKQKSLSVGKLADQLEEIDGVMRGHHGHWEYSLGLDFLYQTIYEQNADDFLALIRVHFERGNCLALDKLQVIKRLLKLLTVQEVLGLLEEHSVTDKALWLLLVFVALPEEQCTPEHSEKIIQLYNQGDVLQYGVGLDYLIKFKPYNNKIVEDVVAILVDRSDENNLPWHALSSLFGFGARDSELLESSFLDDLDLLKKAYFLQLDRSSGNIYHHLHDLNVMLGRDPHFMLECVNHVFDKEEYPSRHSDGTDYSFLWKKENYQALMEELFMHTYSMEPESWSGPYVCSFFRKKSETEPLVRERQDLFLEKILEKYQGDVSVIGYIFRVVENFSDERKLYHIKALLKLKPDIETFKKARLVPASRSWSGSLIPILRREIDFLEDIKSELNGVDFLEHKAHVEELISYQKRRIASEEKREFLEDF